jgi:hypothetical protein
MASAQSVSMDLVPSLFMLRRVTSFLLLDKFRSRESDGFLCRQTNSHSLCSFDTKRPFRSERSFAYTFEMLLCSCELRQRVTPSL